MFFTTTAFALAAASLAMAQGISIDPASLTQCSQSTFNINGAASPYYVAVVNASDPCADALAEYYDVTTQSINYYTNLPQDSSVQLYVLDANNQEYWGPAITVGDGDASCLGGVAAAADSTSSSDSSTDASTTASSSSSSSSSAPTTYVAPTNSAADTGSGSTPSDNGSVANSSDNSDTNTPANAANNSDDDDAPTTGGASTITASTTLLVGAFAAAIALF